MGVLSGIMLQSIKGYREKTYNAVRLSNIDQLDKALQIYMTKAGANAKFPISTGWDCIGATTCWNSGLGPTSLQNTPATNINLALEGNISTIPKDPSIIDAGGDYYVYMYYSLPDPLPTAYPFGVGAYINWYSKNIGSRPCGRGFFMWNLANNFVRCGIYLGK